MTRTVNRYAALICALVTALSLTTPAVSNAATRLHSCYRLSDAQKRLAHKTNAARRAHGLPALHIDTELSQVASRHTHWMKHVHRLFHTRRLTWKITNWRSLGENVGVGPGIRSVQRAFMHSSEHRANILSRGYTHLGVGVHHTRNGTVWMSVEFESISNPGTRLPVPHFRC